MCSVVSPCCRRLRSTMTVRLSRRKCDAAMMASQLLPSWSSPSPVRTNVRQSARSIFAASAMPTPIGSPWPSGPVFASTPGTLLAVGVAVEHRQRLHVGLELLAREEPGLGKRRIEGRRGVPLAQDEAVARRIPGACGVDAERLEEERRQDVGAREIAARVPHPRAVNHAQAGDANAPRTLGDLRHEWRINMHAFLFMRHAGNLPVARRLVNDGGASPRSRVYDVTGRGLRGSQSAECRMRRARGQHGGARLVRTWWPESPGRRIVIREIRVPSHVIREIRVP